jgi:hypothetical protein
MSSVQLRSRSTWIDADGRTVHIAGLTHPRKDLFWSIEGNWYHTDGRFFRAEVPEEAGPAWAAIVREDTSAAAQRWWGLVNTRSKP